MVKKVDFGVYLGEKMDAGQEERVLLPGKKVPAGTKEGDKFQVFIYKDSSDRISPLQTDQRQSWETWR